MRGVATRVAIEAVLIGLGVVVGKTLAWVVVGVGSFVLAVEAARRIRERRSPEPVSLASKLDDLIREGMDLVDDLSVPVKPERTPGGTGWRIDGGPPDGWGEKVASFEQRIRNLLQAEHPALIEAFAKGHNDFLRRERESQKARPEPDPSEDKRPDSQKMLDFVNHSRSGPAQKTEAVLGGLAAARRQLGTEVR